MKHKPVRFGALVFLGIGLASSRVQAVTSGVPDMSDFGNAIAQGVEDAPEPKKGAAPKGPIASGLVVPRVKPGTGARGLFEAMREKTREAGATNPEMLKVLPAYDELEKQAPAIISAMEGEFVRRGFAPRDMGTAYSVAFLQLRENATGKATTETQDAAVVRTVSKVIPGIMGAKWKTLTPASKEKLYETTIMAAVIQGAIIEQLVATGDTERLAAQRKDAADAFKQLIGVPPEQVEISPEGQISGTVPVEAEAATDAPVEDTPQ